MSLQICLFMCSWVFTWSFLVETLGIIHMCKPDLYITTFPCWPSHPPDSMEKLQGEHDNYCATVAHVNPSQFIDNHLWEINSQLECMNRPEIMAGKLPVELLIFSHCWENIFICRSSSFCLVYISFPYLYWAWQGNQTNIKVGCWD